MKTDTTRETFNPLKHFSRVLMQQGRVQLDADWNEQVSIFLHYLRTVTTDLIGPAAGPAEKCGFELIVKDDDLTADEKKLLKESKNVLIAPGRYYVDGLLAENDRLVSFFNQLGKPVVDADTEKELEKAGARVGIYLDVWERHVTPIEDDDIREKALGGADTATRAKITWVVRARLLTPDEAGALPNIIPPTGLTAVELENLTSNFRAWAQSETSKRGLLKAQVAHHDADDDLCSVTPESVYRGVENQLYRVEIHRGGTALDASKKPATFKWSRDNGSVAAAWLDTDGDVLKVTPRSDEAHGFSPGQWVELHDDYWELEGRRGTLAQLKNVEAGSLGVDLATASGSVDRSQFKSNPKVRRWDQAESETIKLYNGAIPIIEDEWITLEDGVQIQFQSAELGKMNYYRTGDYWLIPARVATRDIEWPLEKNEKGEGIPVAMTPHGITHHYALLGLLSHSAAPADTFEFVDCRRMFAPLEAV